MNNFERLSSSYPTCSSDSSYCIDPAHDRLPDDSDRFFRVDVDLVDFAVATWGLNRSKADMIRNRSFVLEHEAISEYLNICNTPGKRNQELHQPFVNICDALLHDVSSCMGMGIDCSSDWWDGQGRKAVGSAHGSNFESRYRKPSLLKTFAAPSAGHVTWEIVKFPVELRRDRQHFHLEATGSAGLSNLASSNIPSLAGNNSLPEPSPGEKRVFYQTDSATTPRIDFPRKKRKLDRELRDARNQLSVLASKCLNATFRHYVVGLYVRNCEVNVVYFDRMRVLQTTPFDFRKDPGALALVVFGLSQCDRRRAGWDPLLVSSPWNAPGPLTHEEAHRSSLPVNDPVGSYFELKGPPETPQAFKITGIIRKANKVIGRATSVYHVQTVSPKSQSPPDDLVLKLTWPLRVCSSEIDTIYELQKKLPPGLSRHLPSVIAHQSFTAEDLQLPWTSIPSIDPSDGNEQERVLRASVSELYIHLWEADSLAEFMQGWLDCVEVHYHAFMTGKVLHRDLSESNLMLRRLKNGTVIGVLNDWDMSSRVDEAGFAIPTITKHLIGTLPFMARQLLSRRRLKPKHLYWHDLESFFYILIWAAIVYDFKTKSRRPLAEDSLLNMWSHSPDDVDVTLHAGAKRDFYEAPYVYKPLLAEIQPEFADLRDKWIRPLHALFTEALEVQDSRGLAEDQDYDHTTCGGILTFEKFMAAIGETPRSFESVLDDA